MMRDIRAPEWCLGERGKRSFPRHGNSSLLVLESWNDVAAVVDGSDAEVVVGRRCAAGRRGRGRRGGREGAEESKSVCCPIPCIEVCMCEEGGFSRALPFSRKDHWLLRNCSVLALTIITARIATAHSPAPSPSECLSPSSPPMTTVSSAS